jgi:putative ABC transport system ATP-binding protein
MTNEAVLSAEHVTRTYGSGPTAVRAVDDVSLRLGAGELVVLRGPSGSGKTTLLNLLGALDAPDSGSVRLDGRELVGADEDDLVELRRSSLGYIFQTFALVPVLSAAENIELPMRIAGLDGSQRRERTAELLATVGLAAHSEQRPGGLSGGQQQRLGIARALANRPRLLIADEPTGQLDSTNADAMMGLISQLVHERGVAAIVSTHDPRMAAYADRVVEIRDGRLAG